MHHLKIAEQESMILLLIMPILLILQCLCKIWLNTVTIILILQEAYGALKRDEVVNNADVTNNNNAPSFE